MKKVYQTSYKTYDSSDTYHVKEKRVLEFHGNEKKLGFQKKQLKNGMMDK